MNSPSKLSVYYRDNLVGALCMDNSGKVCIFQYSKDWLANGFSISPLELPLQDKLFVANANPFNGNFAIFEDSLPDGYGRYLLHRMLKRQGIDMFALNPLQLLSIVGCTGMGALCYMPEAMIGSANQMSDLDYMQKLALDLLSEKTEGNEDLLYFNSGNSGGCRPKTIFTDSFGHWLVKFRHTYDPNDLGLIECKYNEAALSCGINVPNFKLIEDKYFASQRFDIDAAGNRMHIATAAALMRETINPPKADYKNLLNLTGFITQSYAEVEEMFRRMVFNVVTNNKDDHAKNFSFICDNGKWSLAPAYDLTYCPEGYNNEHATSANFNGNPTIDDMITVGKSVRIHPSKSRQIISEIHSKCLEILGAPYVVEALDKK